MRVIFAKGRSWTADVIASVCDTDVSHVALMTDVAKNLSLVFHSTSAGVEICSYSKFKRLYIVRRSYEIPCNSAYGSNYHLRKLFEKYEGCKYDYFAFAYLGLYLCLKKLGIKLPAENRWQNRNHFICTEFASMAIMGHIDSMYTLKSLEEHIKEHFHDLRMSFDDPPVSAIFSRNE